MNYLTLENITKSFGEKLLFQDITMYVAKGQKIALVAKNGTGKSTILKIAAGVEMPEGERGNVLIHKSAKVGVLVQAPVFEPSQTVMEAVFASENPVLQAIKEYEEALFKPEKLQAAINKMETLGAWDYELKIKQILSKLNIRDLDEKVGNLSGGQQKRIALAKVLAEDPDFLILDEPTNHLDMDMIEWLEKFLQTSTLTILMVTHDRYFLERICNTIIELDDMQLYKYKGNYSYFLEQKTLREDIEARTVDKAKSVMRQELKWINRQPKARGTKAKARVDAFEDIKAVATQKIGDAKLHIESKTERMGKKIVELHNVSKRFDDVNIIEKFSYKFQKGERLGIVGNNGAGKSTFLRLITQQLQPDTGKIVHGSTIKFGYYTQDGIRLAEDKRVIQVIKDIAPIIPLSGGRKLTASAFLEQFLFTPEQQYAYVSTLSGGERRRLYLLTVLMENPNFLILDEPTNDLDIMTLNILEDFLFEFNGCVVIVSHDRYFMDKLAHHLFIFQGEGKVKDFNGTHSEYRAYEKAEEQRLQSEQKVKKEKKEYRNKTESKMSYNDRREFKKLTKAIEKLEKRKTEITAKFNDPNITSDDIQKLSIELGKVENSLEEKEDRWLELSELE